jgi:hypothetical protein
MISTIAGRMSCRISKPSLMVLVPGSKCSQNTSMAVMNTALANSGTDVVTILIKEIEREIIKVIGQPDPGYALGPSYEQHADSNLQLLISNIGVLMDWPAAYTPNRGTMDAFMLVQLKGKQGGNFKNIFQYAGW